MTQFKLFYTPFLMPAPFSTAMFPLHAKVLCFSVTDHGHPRSFAKRSIRHFFLLAHHMGLLLHIFYSTVLLALFSIGNVRFHKHEILYMLDTSSLFSLLTLKPVYPVLRTAFLQLPVADRWCPVYFCYYPIPLLLHSALSIILSKGFCYDTIPLRHIILLGSKIFSSTQKNSLLNAIGIKIVVILDDYTKLSKSKTN